MPASAHSNVQWSRRASRRRPTVKLITTLGCEMVKTIRLWTVTFVVGSRHFAMLHFFKKTSGPSSNNNNQRCLTSTCIYNINCIDICSSCWSEHYSPCWQLCKKEKKKNKMGLIFFWPSYRLSTRPYHKSADQSLKKKRKICYNYVTP